MKRRAISSSRAEPVPVIAALVAVTAALAVGSAPVAARESSTVTGGAPSSVAAGALAGRHSGTDDMTPALRAMQADPFQNPGMLSVEAGRDLWAERPGADPGCRDCHDDADRSMPGVAARYPRFDPELGRPVSLGQRIARHAAAVQPARPVMTGPEDPVRLALEAFVAARSAGRPIMPDDDPRLAPFAERGRHHWQQRLGQLDLSCAQCHDERAGRSLAGAVIPQGHPTGYPVYRLEWQAPGSLQRRFGNCLTGIRAEPYPPDSVEAAELELWLMRRAAGLPIETPAVRP